MDLYSAHVWLTVIKSEDVEEILHSYAHVSVTDIYNVKKVAKDASICSYLFVMQGENIEQILSMSSPLMGTGPNSLRYVSAFLE